MKTIIKNKTNIYYEFIIKIKNENIKLDYNKKNYRTKIAKTLSIK